MDSPIDPVNKSTEYVGLPKVDAWHESEKHKKKRFAHMLEDKIEEQKRRDEASDEVVVTAHQEEGNAADAQSENHDTEDKQEKPKVRPVTTEEPETHIDVKG